ncbi:hypothetical protein C1280_27530 [Gemmata obscuriglobus]|uniref:Uncharacterized protein n=1 Tax=Gemmata obscuriglobus TaxID=114 RepID=A0A2Z3HBM5_9BACT|nr:hypothetical protein C1280_27530 [Gemmata obscuriglobus]
MPSKPNPALHLTPPSDSGRIAHPVMAVQVSCLFGNRRARGGDARRPTGAAHRRPVPPARAGLDIRRGTRHLGRPRTGPRPRVPPGRGGCRPAPGRSGGRRSAVRGGDRRPKLVRASLGGGACPDTEAARRGSGRAQAGRRAGAHGPDRHHPGGRTRRCT